MAAAETVKLLLRDALTMAVLVLLVFAALFAYTQRWPPLVSVESGSMMHGNDATLGAIDTGDLVLLKSGVRIVTYVEGRASGYLTYGDYGDVIVFLNPLAPYGADPIIHRPLFYVQPNGTAFDVPALNLTRVTEVNLTGAGWRHDLNLTVALDRMESPRAGYITMGDDNPYHSVSYSYDPWIVPVAYVLGVARGEVPGGGVLKL